MCADSDGTSDVFDFKKDDNTFPHPDIRRPQGEIAAALTEVEEKLWLDRHRMLMERDEARGASWDERVKERAKAAASRIEAKYPALELGPYSDFEWGMLNGKLSALRWVLGSERDFLDT